MVQYDRKCLTDTKKLMVGQLHLWHTTWNVKLTAEEQKAVCAPI